MAKDKVIHGGTIDLGLNLKSESVEAKLKDIVSCLDIIQQSNQLDLKFKNIKGVSAFIQNLAKLDEKLDDIKTSANIAGDELSKSMSKSASKVVEDISSMSAKSGELTKELESLSKMKDLSGAQDKVKKIAKSINASLSFVDPGNLIDVDELLNVKDSQKQLDILSEGLKNFTTGWTSLGQSGIRATDELKHGLAGSSGEADNLQKKLTSIKSLLDEINGNSFKTRVNRIKSDKLDSAKPTRNQEPANLISNAFSDYTDAVGVLKNDSATIEEKTKAYIQLTNAVHDLGWAIEELPDDVDSVLGKKGATQIEEMLDNYRDNYLKLIDSIKKDLQQEINVVMGVEPTVDPNVDGKVKKAVEGSIPEQIEVDTGVKIDVTATIKQLDELLIKFRELKDNKDKTGAAETANEIAKLTLSLQDCGVEFDAIKNQLSASNKRTFSSNAIKDAISQTNELRSHVPEVSAEFDKLNRLLGENFVGKEKFTDIFDAVKKGTMHAEDAYKTIKAAQDEIVKGDAASDVEKLTSALKKTFNTDEIKSGWKTTIEEVESGKVKWIDALTEITKAELDFNNIQNKAIKKDSKKYQNQSEKAQQEAAEANERAKKAEERAEELQKELNKQKQAPSPSPTPAASTPQKIKQQIRDSYSGMLYHGSKSPMTNETYDPSKNKLSNRNLGVGLYFTPDLELASKYGKNILQQNVNLDKIFVLTKDFITDVDALYKAMGKVKPENADWDTIKKDLHGAMMIAENAKAFTKNMQEMGYQGVYSKGYGFADPEVEQLAIYDEKYHQNLTTTPYKDIKKQAEGAAQALEQIEQQEKDIAKAAKEREEIQRKANETPKPSGTGTGTGIGVGTSGASVKAEMEDLNLLDKKVKEVAEVIRNTKTKAFQDEATVVNTSVQKEMEDLDLLIGKLKDVQKEASIELTVSNENPHMLTDPNGNVVTGYRGLKGSYGGLVSGRYHGGTFVTNKKSLAQQYAGENGKIEVVNLSMKNPFEFEGNGRLWNQLRFEGHGENDISRRLSVIREEIKRLFAKIDEGRKKNENTQQYSNKIKELEAERKAIYDDKSNPYGMYDTNKMVEYAKSQGYDGVIFKNIIDSVTGSAEDISDIFVVFNEKQIHYLETLKSAADSIEESQNKIQAEKQDALAAVASDGSGIITPNNTDTFIGNQEQVQSSFSDLKTSSDNVRDAFTGIESAVKNLKEAVDNAVNGINAKVANIDVGKNFGVNSSDNVNLSTYDKILEKMKQIVAERKKFVDVKDDDRLDDILDYKNLIHKKDTHLKPEAAEHQLREIIEAIKYISTLDLSVSLPKHLYDEDHSFKDRKLVDIEHLAKGSDSTFINNWDELIGALQARCLNLLEVINSNDGALERFLSVDDKNVLLSFGIDKLTEDLEEYIATQQQMNKSNKDVRSGIEDITRDILAMARALDISEKDFSSLEYYLHTLTNPLQDMASPNEEANYVMSRIDKNWTSKNDQASSKNSSVDSNLSSTLELLNGTLSKMIGSNDPATQGADSDNGLSGIAKNVKSIYEHLRTNPNDKNKIEQNDYKDTTSDNNDENALLSTLNNLDETLSQLQSWINSNINQENDSELTKLTTDVITPLSNAIIELKNAIAIEDDGQQKVEQVEDTELVRTLNNLNESIARMVGSGDPASQNTDPNKGISGIADNVKNIYGILNGRKDNDGDLANSINNAVKELSNASKYIADDAKLRQESNTKYQAASDRISTEAGRDTLFQALERQYGNEYFLDKSNVEYTGDIGGIVKIKAVLQDINDKFYNLSATIDSQGNIVTTSIKENEKATIKYVEQEKALAKAREDTAKKAQEAVENEFKAKQNAQSNVIDKSVGTTKTKYEDFFKDNTITNAATKSVQAEYQELLDLLSVKEDIYKEGKVLTDKEVADIEARCKKIQDEIDALLLKKKVVSEQKSLISNYDTNTSDIKKAVDAGDYSGSSYEDDIKNTLKEIDAEASKLQNKTKDGRMQLLSLEELEQTKIKLDELYEKLNKTIKAAQSGTPKGAFTKGYDEQLRKASNALDSFKAETKDIDLSDSVKETVSKHEAAIQKLKDLRKEFENTSKGALTNDQKTQWDNAVKEAKEYQTELEKILKIHKKIKSDSSIDINDIAPGIDVSDDKQMYGAMKKYLDQIGGSSAVIKGVGKDHKSLIATFTDAEGVINQITISYKEMNNTLSHHIAPIGQVESAWSKLTTSIGKKVRDMAAYFATFGSVYEVINVIRQGINSVREIDSALTELKKVTNATEAEYNRFLQTMSKTAGIVGSTVKDLTSSAADWARLGYSMQDAGELAATTAKLLNVSEFSSVDDATSALVSTLQAFSKDGENVAVRAEEIVDILNNIGNKYPVATNELATGLATSGAALVAANNSIEEQVALLSAGNATMQDVSTVAAGLKIVAARLRGTTSEVDDDADSAVTNVSKLQKKILALTKDANGGEGINILNEDGGYKSTYEILKEISKVFDKMDDISQASLLELIAGKNRSSVVAAILQNGKILDNAYNDALDSAGSSTNELNTYLDSIQGRIDLFKNALQTMWMNFISLLILELKSLS